MNIINLNGARLEVIGYISLVFLFIINTILPYVPWGLFELFFIIIIISSLMAFFAWPLTVLGFYVKTFQRNSIEEANDKIIKYFRIFFLIIPVGGFYIYMGIYILVVFNSLISIISIIFGVLAIMGLIFSFYMKKYSKQRFDIYKKMLSILRNNSKSPEANIIDYLEDTFSEFGHKMFQNMNEQELIEDFNDFIQITDRNG